MQFLVHFNESPERVPGDISVHAYYFSNNLSIDFVIMSQIEDSSVKRLLNVERHMSLEKGLSQLF